MIVVSDNKIAGMRIVRTLGLVRGNTIRARHLDLRTGNSRNLGGNASAHSHSQVHEPTKRQRPKQSKWSGKVLRPNLSFS